MLSRSHAAETLAEHRGDSQHLEGVDRPLEMLAGAEAVADDQQVARPHASHEVRINILEHVRGQQLQVFPGPTQRVPFLAEEEWEINRRSLRGHVGRNRTCS
jgi:hypothetical protein